MRYLLALGLCLALVACFRFSYVPLTPNSDYTSYVSTAQYFSGIPSAEVYPQRILKPLGPLGVAVLELAATPQTAFIIEVLIFYFLFGGALYFLAFEFFQDRRAALIAALLGTVSYPMMRYGLDLYTETGAQFFYVLALLFMLRYLKAPSYSRLLAAAVTIGIGLLWKEYSLVTGFGFGLMLLFERTPFGQKIKNLILLGVGSLLPSLLVQAWVFENLHYSYLDWYRTGGANGFATEYTPKNLIKSVAALLGLGWVFVPSGVFQIKKLGFGEPRFNFILFSTLASLLCLAWGFVSSRLFFVVAIPAILIAVTAMMRLPKKMQIVATTVILLGNVVWLVVSAGAFGL